MPLHNFQFRAGANLSYFIADEKLLIFRLGKNWTYWIMWKNLLNNVSLDESESVYFFFTVMFLTGRQIRKRIDQ